MKFQWDQRKALSNIKKHDISFEKAVLVFADRDSLSIFDEDHSDNEDRWITLGQISSGEVIVVAHTYRKRVRKN